MSSFLKLIYRDRSSELQEWMAQIKLIAPPEFLDKLAEELVTTEMSAVSPGLKYTSYRKRASAKCAIL